MPGQDADVDFMLEGCATAAALGAEDAYASSDPYEAFDADPHTNQEGNRDTAEYVVVEPHPRARLAVASVLRLVGRMADCANEREQGAVLMEHQWSAFNCPLMWAAAGDADDNPIWIGWCT